MPGLEGDGAAPSPFFSLSRKRTVTKTGHGLGVGRSRGRSAMFLRTERLFLRPAWLEDAPELARAIAHEPVVSMLSKVPWPYREEHARSWIDSNRDPYLPSLLVTLPDEGGRIAGVCGLHEDDRQIEVGYWITP